MKLNVMREFVRLAENQNFTQTAEELYIAQPVLSRHIASIEEELRVKLINRTRNSFELTEEGRLVLEDFKKILEQYGNMLDRLSRLDAEAEGELHLGFLYYDMNSYVAKMREEFRRRFPKVKLYLHSYQPKEIEEDLLNGKLDAAFIYGATDCGRRDLETLPFLTDYRGSVDPKDIRARFRTPLECDWAWMAKFDHEFVGREALEKEMANPKRKLVTLEFNPDDLADVYRSQFTEEPYKYMDMPCADPTYSSHFHTMISHAILDVEQIEEGKEVLVQWGNYGKRIKNLRATIAKFPYIHGVMENRDYDVSTCPSGLK